VESSVVEQADAGAFVVCVGAGAAGAHGEGKRVARPRNVRAWADVEFASGACDACGFSLEEECGAQARKHGPLKIVARYFRNEEEMPEQLVERVTRS
jgi:hypothetical protein